MSGGDWWTVAAQVQPMRFGKGSSGRCSDELRGGCPGPTPLALLWMLFGCFYLFACFSPGGTA